MPQMTKLRAAGENATSSVRAIGRDANLCLRETNEKATCQACMDICPGKAIRIPATTGAKTGVKVTLSKGFCVDCGLCCAVCPTSSFIVLEPTMRFLRQLLKRASASAGGGTCYLTCIETGLAKEDESVVELPCLGALTSEMWTQLMLDFPNLAVYLPSDLCGRCKAKDAEMMIVDAVCAAQEIVGRDLTLVEHRRELEFTDDRGRLLSRGSDDDDPLNLGLGDMVRDITQGVDDDLTEEERGNSDMKKTRVRLRKELTRAEGEETPGCKGAEGLTGIVTASRAAILDSVMRFPQIAGNVKLQGMTLHAEKCTNVDELVEACPLGAVKRDEDGAAYIDKLICVACELCGLVAAGEGAVEPCETCMADLLLEEIPAPAAEE